MLNKKMYLLILWYSPTFSEALRQVKMQHKDMKFLNWGPTTIWHNIECIAFYFSKSLHRIIQLFYVNSQCICLKMVLGIY